MASFRMRSIGCRCSASLGNRAGPDRRAKRSWVGAAVVVVLPDLGLVLVRVAGKLWVRRRGAVS